MTAVKSIPDHPLTETDIEELDTSAATDFCEAIVGRRTDDETTPPTDAVVALWLATDTQTYLLGYEPADGWRVIDEFEWDGVDLEDYLNQSTDQLLDWLDTYYDQSELAFITDTESDDEIEAHLLDILPATPMADDEVDELTVIPGIEHAEPLVTVPDTGNAVLFVTMLFESAYVLGFNATTPEHIADEDRTSTGKWEVRSKQDIDEDADPDDVELDITESVNWLSDQYSEDDLTLQTEG